MARNTIDQKAFNDAFYNIGYRFGLGKLTVKEADCEMAGIRNLATFAGVRWDTETAMFLNRQGVIDGRNGRD